MSTANYDAARMRLVEATRQLCDDIAQERVGLFVQRDQAQNPQEYDDADAQIAALSACYKMLTQLLRGHPINAAHFQIRAMQREIAASRYVIAGMERVIAMIDSAAGDASDEIEAQWNAAVERMRQIS